MTKKTGTREWSEYSMNIQRGCEHNCRYCYARHRAVHRFKLCDDRHWPLPCINEKKVDMPHKKKYDGVVMYPTTHDITQANLSQYLTVLRKLLDAGNQVLIVSKPHWPCITVICEAYDSYKEQITFRFTIGSTENDVLEFWEPGAPGFKERMACLAYAYHRGYRTSVSCEPFLDAYPTHVYEAVSSFLTESFWLGKVRNFNSRIDLTGVTEEEKHRYVEPLRKLQQDSVIKAVAAALKDKPFVKFKESNCKVVS